MDWIHALALYFALLRTYGRIMLEHQYLYIFVITIGTGLLFSLPIFRFLDENVSHHRNTGMDGLRYFLASFVAIFHSDYLVRYVTTGKWETIYNDVSYVAQFSVSIFFMITAFLFWGKISKKDDVNWIELYKDRVFRIAPAAFFTALISIAVILYITGYPTENDYLSIKDVVRWFDMGIYYNYPPINYFKDSWLFLGVFWTLQWEWGFYFSLPLLYIFRRNGIAFVLAMMFFMIYLVPIFPGLSKINTGICLLFLGGMLSFELLGKIKISKKVSELVLIVSLIGIFSYQPELYTTTMLPWYFCMIFSVCKGANLFGTLSFKGFVRLGNASFSVYVLHSVIIYTAYTMLNHYGIITSPSDIKIGHVFAMFVLVCFISTLSYKIVEQPFIKLSKMFRL